MDSCSRSNRYLYFPLSADIERHSMLEQIDALRETIQHKDEIVYGLATKLTELENKISTEQSCNQPISDQERMENYRVRIWKSLTNLQHLVYHISQNS